MNRVVRHNCELKASAEFRAGEMRIWPSVLEQKMLDFLNRHNIEYEFQKVFYIYDNYAKDGWITKYYIADFFITRKNIIIETDGKFHDKHKQHDKMRTKEIQGQYPDIEVLRYRWADLSKEDVMNSLLSRIK